jgi:hypothetical protein
MADEARWIRWDDDKGTIESSFGRLIVLADGFVKGFVHELIASGGAPLGKMIINDLGRDLDISIPNDKAFSWDDFEVILDGRLASFDSIENKPSAYGWDGTGRTLTYQNAVTSKLWPVAFIDSLKSSAEKSLTDKGAHAILGQASRKAGKQIGEMIGSVNGWNGLKSIYETVGEVMTASFSWLGWGKLEVSVDPDRLLMVFVVRNSYEAKAEGKDSRLTITRNLIEGVGEYLSEREGMRSKSREFSLDDGTGARAIVIATIQADKEVDWDGMGWGKISNTSHSAAAVRGL